MDTVYYPKELIFPDSEIKIYLDDKNSFNQTNTQIVIEGNRNGFMSLAHLINVYSVYLEDPIILTEFSFVKSDIHFEISENREVPSDGIVNKIKNNHFEWQISENNLCSAICVLHSLGYANNEIHFDKDLKKENISIYCIVL